MRLEPNKTALLTLDFQKGILGMIPGTDAAIPPAAKAVEFARKKQFQIIHVGLGFAKGHPEIPDHGDSRFARVKQGNLFLKGTSSAEFHSSIARPEELVVYKHRVSAFSENELQRLGGPVATTVIAITVSLSAASLPISSPRAFLIPFAALIALQLLVLGSASRLPVRIHYNEP